jgi:hypothetical protein
VEEEGKLGFLLLMVVRLILSLLAWVWEIEMHIGLKERHAV